MRPDTNHAVVSSLLPIMSDYKSVRLFISLYWKSRQNFSLFPFVSALPFLSSTSIEGFPPAFSGIKHRNKITSDPLILLHALPGTSSGGLVPSGKSFLPIAAPAGSFLPSPIFFPIDLAAFRRCRNVFADNAIYPRKHNNCVLAHVTARPTQPPSAGVGDLLSLSRKQCIYLYAYHDNITITESSRGPYITDHIQYFRV